VAGTDPWGLYVTASGGRTNTEFYVPQSGQKYRAGNAPDFWGAPAATGSVLQSPARKWGVSLGVGERPSAGSAGTSGFNWGDCFAWEWWADKAHDAHDWVMYGGFREVDPDVEQEPMHDEMLFLTDPYGFHVRLHESDPGAAFIIDVGMDSLAAGLIGSAVAADAGPVVIGRDMSGRVIPASEAHGADYFHAFRGLQTLPRAARNRTTMWQDTAWAYRVKLQRRAVLDIGPGSVTNRSPYYEMELRVFRTYRYYERITWD